jgi:hypothetical protein
MAGERANPVTRFYVIRQAPCLWARIWITDDGSFSCISDYGNYGYWWGAPGCEFRRFLCQVDDHYLTTKLQNGERDEYDGEATLAKVRKHIAAELRAKRLTGMEAKRERGLLDQHDLVDGEHVLWAWWQESRLDWCDETPGVYRTPIQLAAFVREVWPLFVAQLRAELAREFAPAEAVGG